MPATHCIFDRIFLVVVANFVNLGFAKRFKINAFFFSFRSPVQQGYIVIVMVVLYDMIYFWNKNFVGIFVCSFFVKISKTQ